MSAIAALSLFAEGSVYRTMSITCMAEPVTSLLTQEGSMPKLRLAPHTPSPGWHACSSSLLLDQRQH